MGGSRGVVGWGVRVGWFIFFPVKIKTLFLLLDSQKCHWNTIANTMISPFHSVFTALGFLLGYPKLAVKPCTTCRTFCVTFFSVSQDTSVSNSRKLNQAHVNKTKGNWRSGDCQGQWGPPEVKLPLRKLPSGIWTLLHPFFVQCFHTSPVVGFVFPE